MTQQDASAGKGEVEARERVTMVAVGGGAGKLRTHLLLCLSYWTIDHPPQSRTEHRGGGGGGGGRGPTRGGGV